MTIAPRPHLLREVAPALFVLGTVASCMASIWWLFAPDPMWCAIGELAIFLAVTASLAAAWRWSVSDASRRLVGVWVVFWVPLGGLTASMAIDSFLHPSHAIGFSNPTEGESGNLMGVWLMLIGFGGYGGLIALVFVLATAGWRRWHRSPTQIS